MAERNIVLLNQYDLSIRSIKKGRGQWIITCDEGIFALKECTIGTERLKLQDKIVQQIKKEDRVYVQETIRTKEGNLIAIDIDSSSYMLQTYPKGRECDANSEQDLDSALEALANIHNGMQIERGSEEVWIQRNSLLEEFLKKNKELRKIRRYLREKKQKNDFERLLYKAFDVFFDKAMYAECNWKEYEKMMDKEDEILDFCHGDFQHHNVWFSDEGVMIVQFEKLVADFPSRDLYLFMRKKLEKCGWDYRVGQRLLQIYEMRRPLPAIEKVALMYRFAYPDKFWKIANHYYNNKKNVISEKSMEKLEQILLLEDAKSRFIERAFAIGSE
ncbi:MAG: hypothetical protein R3Y47_00580 [Lachnospiraceae bacterium]